jgi:hypothetical protein
LSITLSSGGEVDAEVEKEGSFDPTMPAVIESLNWTRVCFGADLAKRDIEGSVLFACRDPFPSCCDTAVADDAVLDPDDDTSLAAVFAAAGGLRFPGSRGDSDVVVTEGFRSGARFVFPSPFSSSGDCFRLTTSSISHAPWHFSITAQGLHLHSSCTIFLIFPQISGDKSVGEADSTWLAGRDVIPAPEDVLVLLDAIRNQSSCPPLSSPSELVSESLSSSSLSVTRVVFVLDLEETSLFIAELLLAVDLFQSVVCKVSLSSRSTFVSQRLSMLRPHYHLLPF